MTATDSYEWEEEVNTLGWLYSLAVRSGHTSPDKKTSSTGHVVPQTTLRTHPSQVSPEFDMPFSIANRNS
jgi:hypothetical protein